MNSQDLVEFCRRELSASTGNRPEALIQFYSDPARPERLRREKH